jgi:hypothetical protein
LLDHPRKVGSFASFAYPEAERADQARSKFQECDPKLAEAATVHVYAAGQPQEIF